MDCNEISWRRPGWWKQQVIKFWWQSGSPCWLLRQKSGHYILNNSWVDFNEIFRIALQWYKEQSYYNSSSVCLFVPYVLRGPLTDLRQTWWVYVGWPPICPWGVLFRKGQRVDGSTGHFRFPLCYICSRLKPHHCKKHTAYDSRQHQTHATPLTKAHGIFCSLETGNFLVD